ncbi:polysaccharide deacetylase [Halalkalicoccus jeotgali B3]|uniref:Polysaccharide deacetylase n=1 Tax=Halalkalicoccus jeotgali (strain DSM 18796 / CECT 7217 / JCM 14584 / KCTC 4019 / B3) TaxID=795797 RepID=D8JAU0_HALJB|nr:polysaccharide deacetylase [Halalkalicoccus jeotgali B3]
MAGCLGSLSTDTDEPTDHIDDTDNESDDGSDDEDSTPPEPPDGGAVVFVYDDGPMEDYTQALPAHRRFDAPATVGIVSDWVGRADYQDNGCMDVEHLEELVDAGWEIASHTTEHTTLGTFELLKDAHPDDTRIYPEEIRHGYHRGKTIEIINDEHDFTRTVADYGTDGTGRYVEVDTPIDRRCLAGETIVRYPEEQMRTSLEESKRALEGMGFSVETLLAPYDNFGEYARQFATEHYSGVANARHGERVNAREGFDPYRTRRDYFIEYTDRESVTRDLDEIAETGALGVVGAHTFKEEVTEERIADTLSWVHERDITVLTLREAIERYAR